MVIDIVGQEGMGEAPWCMLFADDIVLICETKEELASWLEGWRVALEEGGLKISRSKTEYLKFNGDGLEEDIDALKLEEEEVNKVRTFKYLGSHISESGELDVEINHRIQAGWRAWRQASGVLCDRKISIRLKGRFYKTVVRPAMLYGSETWAIKKAQEKRLEVAEMRMLRWMCGVSRRDRLRNDHVRGSLKVTGLGRKIQERRLCWYGHVMRREVGYVGRRTMDMLVEGKRRRGRPRLRWMDKLREDLAMRGLSEDLVGDRAGWKAAVRNSDPI